MKDLAELKNNLADELEASFRRGNIINMPRVPMTIFYTDDEAKKAKKEVDLILQQTWGNRKNDIVQLLISDDAFFNPDSGEELDTERVQELVDEMYSKSSFSSMNQLCVVFVHNTSQCLDLDAFKERFEVIHKVENYLPSSMISTSIVFVDESTKNRKNAEAIRRYLQDLLDEGKSPYLSTILISNRMSDGSLLANEDRIRENYAMAGWIMILMNGFGEDYVPDLELFFPAGKEHYLTAAFSEVNRPNRAICDIVLHSMLSWIDAHMMEADAKQSKHLQIEDLCNRLGISGNQAKFIEDFFEENVADKIPSPDVLRFLPMRQAGVSGLESRDIRTVDQITMKGFSAFLSGISIFDKELKEEFSVFVKRFLCEKLSAAERAASLSVSNIQQLLSQLKPDEEIATTRSDQYIYKKIYNDFLNWALPICKEVMEDEQSNSEINTKEFESVIEDFQQGYFPDPMLVGYYTDVTKSVLDSTGSGLGKRLLDEINANGDQRDKIFSSLKKAAEEIFTAKSVFSMPLEQEMVTRMGQNPNEIHNQIYNALFKDIDKKVRLNTTIALSPLKQITIVNVHDKSGNPTELYQSIKKNVSSDANMIYFDSCNSNTIKILRLYSCGSSSLL